MSNDKKPYFPLFVDLNEKQIVVVVPGTIAKRRIRTLVFFYQPSHSHCTGSQPGASGYGESRDAQDQKKKLRTRRYL